MIRLEAEAKTKNHEKPPQKTGNKQGSLILSVLKETKGDCKAVSQRSKRPK